MTYDPVKCLRDGLMQQFNIKYTPYGFMGQAAASLMSGQQQASTFNYRKFSKVGEYSKGDLRRIVTMIAENGYIRRVK